MSIIVKFSRLDWMDSTSENPRQQSAMEKLRKARAEETITPLSEATLLLEQARKLLKEPNSHR